MYRISVRNMIILRSSKHSIFTPPNFRNIFLSTRHLRSHCICRIQLSNFFIHVRWRKQKTIFIIFWKYKRAFFAGTLTTEVAIVCQTFFAIHYYNNYVSKVATCQRAETWFDSKGFAWLHWNKLVRLGSSNEIFFPKFDRSRVVNNLHKEQLMKIYIKQLLYKYQVYSCNSAYLSLMLFIWPCYTIYATTDNILPFILVLDLLKRCVHEHVYFISIILYFSYLAYIICLLVH